MANEIKRINWKSNQVKSSNKDFKNDYLKSLLNLLNSTDGPCEAESKNYEKDLNKYCFEMNYYIFRLFQLNKQEGICNLQVHGFLRDHSTLEKKQLQEENISDRHLYERKIIDNMLLSYKGFDNLIWKVKAKNFRDEVFKKPLNFELELQFPNNQKYKSNYLIKQILSNKKLHIESKYSRVILELFPSRIEEETEKELFIEFLKVRPKGIEYLDLYLNSERFGKLRPYLLKYLCRVNIINMELNNAKLSLSDVLSILSYSSERQHIDFINCDFSIETYKSSLKSLNSKERKAKSPKLKIMFTDCIWKGEKECLYFFQKLAKHIRKLDLYKHIASVSVKDPLISKDKLQKVFKKAGLTGSKNVKIK